MHQSRRELLDDFVGFVGERNDDEARDVAERLLNRSLTALWLKRPWRVFRSPVPFQLTLVVGQSRYALPDYFGRVGPGMVRNLTQGGSVVYRLEEGDLERRYPSAGTTLEVPGFPGHYEIAGVCGVHTQPAVTGEALEAVSSDNGDTDVVLALAGDDLSGRWTRTQVTLTGMTPVALGTWSFLDECGKAYRASVTPVTEGTSSRGTVTVRQISDAGERQSLFAQESAREHEIVTIYPKPQRADVLALPVIRRPKRVFQDADALPDLWGPAIFEEMILQWQVNTGALTPVTVAAAPTPKFDDLVAFENQQAARARKRPFGGMR